MSHISIFLLFSQMMLYKRKHSVSQHDTANAGNERGDYSFSFKKFLLHLNLFHHKKCLIFDHLRYIYHKLDDSGSFLQLHLNLQQKFNPLCQIKHS